MIARELINHIVPPLKLADDGHKASSWMQELGLSQLPVVDKGKFLGLITEDIILDQNNRDKFIDELQLIGTECLVSGEMRFYDIIKTASNFNVEVVGVANQQEEYLGAITIQDIIDSFTQTSKVQLLGGVIVLSLNQIDYSLSKISRLIEEENAKILSCLVKEDSRNPSKIRLILKINKTDLSSITATLERFEYRIIARFQESKILEHEKEKVGMLLKYLNI